MPIAGGKPILTEAGMLRARLAAIYTAAIDASGDLAQLATLELERQDLLADAASRGIDLDADETNFEHSDTFKRTDQEGPEF